MLTPVLIKRRSPHHGPPHHLGTLGTRLALRVWSPPSSRVGPGSNFLHSRLGLSHRVPGPAAQPRRLSSVKLGHFLETRSSLPSTSVYYPTHYGLYGFCNESNETPSSRDSTLPGAGAGVVDSEWSESRSTLDGVGCLEEQQSQVGKAESPGAVREG